MAKRTLFEHTLNSKGSWRTFTTSDGLAGLQVEHIAEDHEGYLWCTMCPAMASTVCSAGLVACDRLGNPAVGCCWRK